MEKLNIWMMPTLVLAKNNKIDRQLMGLDWVASDGILNTLKLEKKLCEFGFFEEEYYALQLANPKNTAIDIDAFNKEIDDDELNEFDELDENNETNETNETNEVNEVTDVN